MLNYTVPTNLHTVNWGLCLCVYVFVNNCLRVEVFDFSNVSKKTSNVVLSDGECPNFSSQRNQVSLHYQQQQTANKNNKLVCIINRYQNTMDDTQHIFHATVYNQHRRLNIGPVLKHHLEYYPSLCQFFIMTKPFQWPLDILWHQ